VIDPQTIYRRIRQIRPRVGSGPRSAKGPNKNILSRDQQIAAISALTEGCSIRATERLTGIHRDTIMRPGVRVGGSCAVLHNETMRFVQVNRLELDELWSYVGKKQRKVKQTDPADVGDSTSSSASTRPARRSSPTVSASATGTTRWPS